VRIAASAIRRRASSIAAMEIKLTEFVDYRKRVYFREKFVDFPRAHE